VGREGRLLWSGGTTLLMQAIIAPGRCSGRQVQLNPAFNSFTHEGWCACDCGDSSCMKCAELLGAHFEERVHPNGGSTRQVLRQLS